MSRFLIIGCGYVGSALAERLIHHGPKPCEVFGVRRSATALPDGVQPIIADLHDPDFAAKLPAARFDYVFSCVAAKANDAVAYERTYVHGAERLVAALRTRGEQPKRLLFTSSTAVYGVDDGSWVDENSPTQPRDFRGELMLAAEQVFLRSGFPATVLRLGGIYGPGRTRFLERARQGGVPWPAALTYTNRIHKDDCAGALAHLCGLEHAQEVYIGVDDEPCCQSDVLKWLGVPPPHTVPSGPAQGKRCRNAKLLASGYAFAYPSFREGYGALLATR